MSFLAISFLAFILVNMIIIDCRFIKKLIIKISFWQTVM